MEANEEEKEQVVVCGDCSSSGSLQATRERFDVIVTFRNVENENIDAQSHDIESAIEKNIFDSFAAPNVRKNKTQGPAAYDTSACSTSL